MPDSDRYDKLLPCSLDLVEALKSQNPSSAQPAAQCIPRPGVPICAAALVSNLLLGNGKTQEFLLIPDNIIICPDASLLICGSAALMILSGPK